MDFEDNNEIFKCRLCGREKKTVGTTEDFNNTNYGGTNNYDNKNNQKYYVQKSSEELRDKKIIDDIEMFVNKYNKTITDKVAPVPIDICQDTANLFNECQNHLKTKRGDIRKRLMAACMEVCCFKKNIARSYDEISTIFSLQSGYMSGRKLLRRLKKLELIDIPDNYEDNSEFCFNRLCEVFPPIKDYKSFMVDVFQQFIKSNSYRSFKPESIIAGSIVILNERKKLNLDMKKIEEECGVKNATAESVARDISIIFEFYNCLKSLE
jgi:transcription initiation factor TFIIIB Brf1 subunit/transcription initiation factor TFIIB